MMVIVLIAVLMALSLPMLSSANDRARSEVCRDNLIELGRSVADYAYENEVMPTLSLQSNAREGFSIPRFVDAMGTSPYVVFCPSDESDRSKQLGTSYRWAERFNGKAVGALAPLIGQSMLFERKAFHPTSLEQPNALQLSLRGDDYAMSLSRDEANPQQANDRAPIVLHQKNRGRGPNPSPTEPRGKALGITR
jgi:hypothetical protein